MAPDRPRDPATAWMDGCLMNCDLANLDLVNVPTLDIRRGVIVGRTYSQPVQYDIMTADNKIFTNVAAEFVRKAAPSKP